MWKWNDFQYHILYILAWKCRCEIALTSQMWTFFSEFFLFFRISDGQNDKPFKILIEVPINYLGTMWNTTYLMIPWSWFNECSETLFFQHSDNCIILCIHLGTFDYLMTSGSKCQNYERFIQYLKGTIQNSICSYLIHIKWRIYIDFFKL